MSQRSIEAGRRNLKPPKPGERRNPLGINFFSKQKAILREAALEVLGEPVDITVEGQKIEMTRLKAVILAIVRKAMRGDVAAATWVRDTAFGRPAQMVEVDMQGGLRLSLSSVPEILGLVQVAAVTAEVCQDSDGDGNGIEKADVNSA